MPFYFQTSFDRSLSSRIYLHITRRGNHTLTHLYDAGIRTSAWLPLPSDWGLGALSALVKDPQHSTQSLAQSRPVKTRRHVWGRV